MSAHFDDGAIARLTDYASRWTGFSRDAILPDAIRRAASRLVGESGSPEELLLRASHDDREVVHALCQAVSVGETFFFRQPEHFRFVAESFLPRFLESGRKTLRAWSAGCATGEEAYSIAACLLDRLPSTPHVQIEVVGTDLLERNVAAARAASYGQWSRRASAPMLHPLFAAGGDGDRMRIDERVRAVTSFWSHNLLERMDQKFDLVFCRNVLVYFSPKAVDIAVAHLSRALTDHGTLFFGSMDLPEAPRGFAPASAAELQIFQRTKARQEHKVARPAPQQPIPAPRHIPRVRPPEPVALHLKALVHIERGDRKTAEKELADLTRLVPDYVPGILERALLHVRFGERNAAATLMREVLKRLEKLPADEILAGPEPLPVSFFRESAQAFLRSARGGLG